MCSHNHFRQHQQPAAATAANMVLQQLLAHHMLYTHLLLAIDCTRSLNMCLHNQNMLMFSNVCEHIACQVSEVFRQLPLPTA